MVVGLPKSGNPFRFPFQLSLIRSERGNTMKSVLGLFVAIFLLCGSASAMMVGLSTEELTRNSQAIIKGVVEEKQSYWSADGKMIMTKAYVRVSEAVKQSGNDIQPGNRVAIEYLGGEKDGLIMKVSAVTPLSIGEEVLLFINPVSDDKRTAKNANAERVYNIFGFAQGKYSISKDGIARKNISHAIVNKKEVVEDNLSVEELISKIRRVK